MLTKKQAELLEYIKKFIKDNNYSPSYREIMKGLNYKSVSTVASHINNLILKGYLSKQGNSFRSLETVNKKDEKLIEKGGDLVDDKIRQRLNDLYDSLVDNEDKKAVRRTIEILNKN